MLPDREQVQAELVRQLRLLEEVGHSLLGRHARAEIAEGGESELHGLSISGSC
jgi:hypothetical protein